MRSHFDLSLLPPAECQFVVIADTHYMMDPGDRPVEFESRRKQTARIELALKLVASLEPEWVIHMGDLTQTYPGSADFAEARREAMAQLEEYSFNLRHVAGNQDVGDKPDKTMPTDAVKPAALEEYHRLFGPSCYSFDHGDCHFIILNSQILNSGLPQEERQREWLESDLEANKNARKLLFFHLPPYLWDENEPSLGHYDNIGQPARKWLLELVRRYSIEVLATGHVHFQFFDRIGPARFYTLVSPSFTRPGFGTVFPGGPPPEQGRDDAPKLGFYLFRVRKEKIDLHFLRTGGETEASIADGGSSQRLVTRLPGTLPKSPLGITLLHPLVTSAEVPIAFPSTIRQRVRNDYPFLSCLELGVRAVRAPWTDLMDAKQSARLSMLRDEGFELTVFLPEGEVEELPGLIESCGSWVDAWEIQLADAIFPSPQSCALLQKTRALGVEGIAFCAIIPGRRTEGKQHARTRVGYRLKELVQLNDALKEKDFFVERVLCRLETSTSPWEEINGLLDQASLSHIGGIDFLLELPTLNDHWNTLKAVESLFAAALLPDCRLFFEPLIDLDRTMDIRHGLLDTLCNPRPPFHALRCLNTILFSNRAVEKRIPSEFSADGLRALQLVAPAETTTLFLPKEPAAMRDSWENVYHAALAERPSGRLYYLASGTVENFTVASLMTRLKENGVSEPLLTCTP